ncbi:MAG: hypothetical protein AAGG50_17385 [Bacteroidota bacterium]
MRLPFFITLLAFMLSGCASTQPARLEQTAVTLSDLPHTEVDRFEVRGYEVIAYFEDPLPTVMRSTPGFARMSPREQGEKLVDHLRSSVLYRFEIISPQGDRVGEFGLQGRPEARVLYERVEYRRHPSGVEAIDPEASSVMGYLFEHMQPFQSEEGSRVVGNAVPFFGDIIMRVIPYEEVKSDMIARIRNATRRDTGL